MDSRISPFVTNEEDFEHRGGELITHSPAVLYTDSENLAFVTVHLSNLIHPMVVLPGMSANCRERTSFHFPFKNFEKVQLKVEMTVIPVDPIDCFHLAVKNGHRTLYANENKCYSGSAVNLWIKYDDVTGDCDIKYGNLRNPIEYMHMLRREVYQLSVFFPWENVNIYMEVDGEVKFHRKLHVNSYVSEEQWRSTSNFYYANAFNGGFKGRRPDRKGVEMTSCESYNPMATDRYNCSVYFSPYGSLPWGTGHFASFVYVFRNLQNGFKYPHIKVYGDGKHFSGHTTTFEQYLEIRHIAQPRILLDENIGICEGEFREVVAQLVYDGRGSNVDHLFTSRWTIVTKETLKTGESHTIVPYEMNQNTMMFQRKNILVFFEATTKHSRVYEVRVKSPYGATKARTKITIYQDFPRITWISPSPHVLVEDVHDIVEIKTNVNEHIRSIDWYHEGKLVKPPNDFLFIDFTGYAYQKKRLLVKRLNGVALSGMYRVVLRGAYCTFERSTKVDVHIRPLIKLESSSLKNKYMVGVEGNDVIISATIKGFHPPVERGHIYWAKDNAKIGAIRGSRIFWKVGKIRTDTWKTTLTIKNVSMRDKGEYSVTAGTGKTVSTVAKPLYIREKDAKEDDPEVDPDEKTSNIAASRKHVSSEILCMACIVLYHSLEL